MTLESTTKDRATVWPEGKHSAVALAFDLDGPTGDAMLIGDIWDRPAYFSQGAYGPWRALDRILALLEKRQVRATFFTPAWVVETWPEQCRAIVERGHEVGHHGYQHEKYWDLSVDQQRQVIRTSQRIFRNTLGAEAVGFRTPSGDWRPETPHLLADQGFEYSSSMRGDDRPYFHPGGRLVEIPARSDMDDYASLAYTTNPDWPIGGDRIASYELTLDNWIREFDGYHREGLCLTTIFHPKVVGKPGRAVLLDRWMAHMQASDEVWFATCAEVSRWCRTNNPKEPK
ncbi:polysaccharide deacetylase [Pseudarthrobacter sp. AG30]|uniref:polysaccharide deacetylase family protein n=1 Tax=Pseudarthrobacter sp. AG30 TaxID=2249742 RepID=UPI000D6E485B|nr:polysaccharide deacetylase [Pseudarthrobacter sp. AG30]RAX14929.1 polysaccharide deacetylase [Pseudarthrobacter sp. AG30]